MNSDVKHELRIELDLVDVLQPQQMMIPSYPGRGHVQGEGGEGRGQLETTVQKLISNLHDDEELNVVQFNAMAS